MSIQKVNFEGEVRRIDLHLRTLYVEIETIIYKISDTDYRIFIKEFSESVQDLQDKFQRKIRFIGTPVALTVDHILEYKAIIPPINDKEIARNFEGLPMNTSDLYNLLLIKFPDINIYKIEGAQPIIIRVYSVDEPTEMGTVSHYISKDQRGKLLEFLYKLGIATNFEIIEDKLPAIPKLEIALVDNPVQFLNSNKLWDRNTGEFSYRDEALWFDNIDRIFDGSFKKNDLYFFEPEDYSCYIDYTSGNHIDIRNFLLLYKTVYITPPYEKNIKEWLKKQRITEDEYLTLVQRGRIKVILSQPEFRYEMGLFNEMYNISPNSVITRRAIAALHQIDVVELADNFLFKEPSDFREMKRFCEAAAPFLGCTPEIYFEMMTWPIRARRGAFEILNQKGGFATAAYGVNNFASKFVNGRLGKSYEFEFSVSAENIHLAHALNATYYPFRDDNGFSDAFFAHTMGIYLNMIKLSTREHLSLLSKSNDELPTKPLQLNPIDVIEVNDYMPILEFDNILTENRFYPSGKRLMETLAPLSPEQRQAKINKYNELVAKALDKGKSKEFKIDLSTNLILDGVGAVTNFMGLGSAFSILKTGSKALVKRIPGFQNVFNQLEDAYYSQPDKSNVHFLTKINRVASVKKF